MANPLRLVYLSQCTQGKRFSLLQRSQLDIKSVLPEVEEIVSEVKEKGDKALLEYTEAFDGVKLSAGKLRVLPAEVKEACRGMNSRLQSSLKSAVKNITKFYSKQMPEEWSVEVKPGIRVEQLIRPLDRVGIYVPGGLARYPSTVLMTAVPAKVAGVRELYVCTPPRKNGEVDGTTLAACDIAGVNAVFRAGGAQAIAAMAYGTGTVPRVDKIVGPGNIYVTAAKYLVSADVGIDFLAGPSEVLVLADDSADPEIVAVELMAQAEHGPSAAAVLVTPSENLALEVRKEVEKFLRGAPREDVLRNSLGKYGLIVVAKDVWEAVNFVNDYAPEHLVLMTGQPKKLLKRIKNAGAIFLGKYSPVAAGDFMVGPSHVLPTGGGARWRSGLSVFDFLKMPAVQELTKKGLEDISGDIRRIAEAEELFWHKRSVEKRRD